MSMGLWKDAGYSIGEKGLEDSSREFDHELLRRCQALLFAGRLTKLASECYEIFLTEKLLANMIIRAYFIRQNDTVV
jgi:hypothetical protein